MKTMITATNSKIVINVLYAMMKLKHHVNVFGQIKVVNIMDTKFNLKMKNGIRK